jgi:hypothetical protein
MLLQPKKRKFKYLQEESYLAQIRNSVGSKAFRNFFVVDEKGKRLDALQDGNLSCAYFVSVLLRNFGLIKKLHFTVGKTVLDMLDSGWKKVSPKKLKAGDVLVWIEAGKGDLHNHIGFFVGNGQAVSNSETARVVAMHHYTYDGKRIIELALRPNWKKADAKG